ncbi:hypothetical protein [Parabacteroides johnsonii]|uniref:hypothetical protein n=1 Tax=Parabacteroides johnsonii TaxID=387661 RepID=UPI003AB59F12
MRPISKEERKEVYAALKSVLDMLPIEKQYEICNAILWFILEGIELSVSIESKAVIAILKPYLAKHQLKHKEKK